HDQAPARVEINQAEAGIVHRIFRDYANGRSLKDIAYELNRENVPFPAKDTKRGPARRGWAPSAIQFILQNPKYVGDWTWNKTRFIKDPDTGRRRPVPRPPEEWIRVTRPDLRIIEDPLWHAVRDRSSIMRERFASPDARTPGASRTVYSHRWLSG